MQVLSQDICQVRPSGGFGECDNRLLGPSEISNIDAVRVVMMMVVVVVVVTLMFVMVVMVVMVVVVTVMVVVVAVMVIVGGFSDAAKAVTRENEKFGGI